MHRLFDPLIEKSSNLGAGLDWKTSLQELTATEGLGVPEYLVTETGPDHEKTFTAAARVGGVSYGTGTGRSKKEAEQQAAESAWRAIQRRRGRARRGGDHGRADEADGRQPGRRPVVASHAPPTEQSDRAARCPVRRGAVARLFRPVSAQGVDRCPSCPRSRSSGAGWSAGSAGARSPRSRCCTRVPCAGTSRAAADFAAAAAGHRFGTASRRGKYLWLPLGGHASRRSWATSA